MNELKLMKTAVATSKILNCLNIVAMVVAVGSVVLTMLSLLKRLR